MSSSVLTRATATRDFANEIAGIIEDFVRRSRAEVHVEPEARREPRTLKKATQDFHRGFVLEALEAHRSGARWNISATSKELGIARSYLYALIYELGLPENFASAVR